MSTNANICQRLRTLSESLGADAEICEYAAARIEELEHELMVMTASNRMNSEYARAFELQLADAKADSGRLDWIEEGGIVREYSHGFYAAYAGASAHNATSLRAAIDAARKP